MAEKNRRGRPPQGTRRERPLNIYLSQPREALFQRIFDEMQRQGLLPATAEINRSRTFIIDHALDALWEKLHADADDSPGGAGR